MEANENLNFKNNLKCEKCDSIPDFTIFNSQNRVKIFSECKNKHLNICLLDDYIKKSYSYINTNNCEKCKKEANIRMCQFCNNFLCEECNNNHLTIDHIINNRISNKIYDSKYLDNIDEEDKFKSIKEKISNSIKYLKDIIEYYKRLENNFKKFLVDNINEIILIKILLNNYMENKKEEEKLINNIDFLLKFNELEFKTENLNEFLLDNKNYILYGDRYKGEKKNEEYEGRGEMEYYNGKYEGEWKNGKRRIWYI